jgi:hypothetical protein
MEGRYVGGTQHTNFFTSSIHQSICLFVFNPLVHSLHLSTHFYKNSSNHPSVNLSLFFIHLSIYLFTHHCSFQQSIGPVSCPPLQMDWLTDWLTKCWIDGWIDGIWGNESMVMTVNPMNGWMDDCINEQTDKKIRFELFALLSGLWLKTFFTSFLK